MTNYLAGHDAEKVAARYLGKQGYKIVALNWRHVRAEIDIVAEKREAFGLKKHLVFFEVKYRRTAEQGHGLDYITPKKLQQMQFAAQLYVAECNYTGEYCLGAVELAGEPAEITSIIEQI
jgi:putative endonuclease